MTVNISSALRKVGDKLYILYGEKADNAEVIAGIYQKENDSIRIKPVPGTRMLPHMESPADFMAAYDSITTVS